MSKEVIGSVIAIIILGGGYFLYTQKNANFKFNRGGVIENNGSFIGSYDSGVIESVKLPTEGDYIINSGASILSFSATRIAGTPHVGTVGISDGFLSFSKNGTTGEFIIDMTSITESKYNDSFLGQINSADFFDVENFRTATFEIIRVGTGPGESILIMGNLTIVGLTNEIIFSATPKIDEHGVTVKADILIDRTRWGIDFDSGSIFTDLGDKAIKDEVGISLDLIFDRL